VFCLPRTNGFASRVHRLGHWADHQADFGGIGVARYEARADRFLSKPVHVGIRQCTRKGGDIVRFDLVTDESAVMSTAGVVRSYFKPMPCVVIKRKGCHRLPDNLTYFHETCKT
jgi:pyocin large subunit-like protein